MSTRALSKRPALQATKARKPLQTVPTDLNRYDRSEWPSTPQPGNVSIEKGMQRLRLVQVRVGGALVRLFAHEYRELEVPPEGANDDPVARKSVSDRISEAISEFMTERRGRQFHAEELRQHVRSRCGEVAPGSPDRILRDLRQSGRISYKCISKSASLYEAL